MDIEIKSWCYDILQSIKEIDSYFPDGMNAFIEYERDTRTRRAVERNIEIIGEAINRILKKNPEFQLAHSRQIIDTRNRIIHGYDSVSAQIVW